MAIRSSKDKLIRPPIRWVGGKYQIVRNLLQLLPANFGRLIEPMAGSAAFFFALKPDKAILFDINEDLINYYQVLKTKSFLLISRLMSLRASKQLYYEMRSRNPNDELERAVRFAYLNRLCWNGVYRVNKDGFFNVPIGSRLPKKLWEKDHLEQCANLLQSAELHKGDFEETLKYCQEADLVFIDPPYPKGTKSGPGFNRYSPNRFGIQDHYRLAGVIKALHVKDVNIMVTLSNDQELISIYPSELNKTVVKSSSLISCNGQTRGPTAEVVLRNYY